MGYWYAYHTKEGRTKKRYLGPAVMVTLERLEHVAQELNTSPSPPLLAQETTSPSLEQHSLLLSTKLAPPRLPISLMERSRLQDELAAACSYPFTLVSASAGSGKTTLLSAWAAAFGSPQASTRIAQGTEQMVAWLSLDALDNDPIRFWASVIAALRTCVPHLGQTALALLHAQEAPPLSVILTAFLNELAQGAGAIILILDDYHVISDQAIHDSLLFLLDHLPARLHLVLATRIDSRTSPLPVACSWSDA